MVCYFKNPIKQDCVSFIYVVLVHLSTHRYGMHMYTEMKLCELKGQIQLIKELSSRTAMGLGCGQKLLALFCICISYNVSSFISDMYNYK